MRIGFIGAGNIGQAHMEGFASLREEGVELASVFDVHREVAEECAAKFEIVEISASAEAMIDSTELDAIVLAVPNRWHAPLAIAALEAGKHVLLEKPMGANLGDALAIYEAKVRTGGVVMMCHQMRWTWWAQAMKERCSSGQLGDIYHARSGWMRRKGIPGWGTWFTQKEISGGGTLIDIGVHMLDVTLHLLGNPKPLSVSGVTAAKFGPERRGIGKWGTPDWGGRFDVEDFASAFIRLEGGSTLSLDVSWAAHVDRPAEYIDLLGDAAGLSYYGGDLKLLSEREGETHDEVIESPGTNERLEMIREFVAAVGERRQPACGAYSGLVNNAVLDAIYRSSEAGAEVAVELPDRPGI